MKYILQAVIVLILLSFWLITFTCRVICYLFLIIWWLKIKKEFINKCFDEPFLIWFFILPIPFDSFKNILKLKIS